MLSSPIPWLLIIPLAMAVLTLLAPMRWRAALSLVAMVLLLMVSFSLWQEIRWHGSLIYSVGGWGAPLGINLQADSLAAVMVGVTALVGLGVNVHGAGYLKVQEEAAFFWPLLWFVLAALNGIWLASDIFNLYVQLELLTLAAVSLAVLTAQAGALVASLRYLLMALLGSLLYLLGVALIYAVTGTLALADLAAALPAGPATLLALALMFVGLAFKSALWPLHGWLPPAHGGALTPVSALLSALVVKAGFYILMRLWLAVEPGLVMPLAAQLAGVLGTGAIFWGGLLALRQNRLKMVVAYSTVAQLGYLFLLFPLMAGTSPEASSLAGQGTVLQLMSHALAKAALFLAAGNLVLAVGGDGVKNLNGISQHGPLALVSFALASVSLMGLPPSGGFLAKWLLLQSALSSGQWWWVLVLILGGLLTAAYLFRVIRQAFLVESTGSGYQRTPLVLELPPLLLALAALLLGLVAAIPLGMLETMFSGVGGA